MTTQTWLANTTGKTEASAGTAVTLRAAQSGASKKLTVNSGLISFLQNSTALTLTGQSLTGSQTAAILDAAATWNTSGAATAIKANITDTNSAAGSALLDLQVGGVSQFKVSKAGAITSVGVAVPTISSSDTLSNKTLSSPTLSGTVAGAASWSGKQTFSAFGTTIELNGVEPRLDFYQTDAGLNEKRWSIIADSTNLFLQTRSDADVFGANFATITRSGTTVSSIDLAATTLTFNSVAVPTISSTDTLSNKTLSSPTLSGTVAGSASWSGVQTFPDGSKIGDLLGGNGEARLNDDSAFFSWYNSANTVRSGYLQMTSAGAVVLASEISGANINITTAGAGVLQLNSVAVPTISSTDTLTNKTLSSPTISGTVVLSGSPTFSGAITAQSGGTASGTFALGTGLNAVISASSGATLSINAAGYTTVNIGGTNLQFNSVAVPTISSTDTLSNKTLSGVTMADATNIVLNTTTGTKIGTSTSQKLGFFNATPVVQPTAVADATDAATVITQLNALLTRMRNLGLIAT